MPKRRRLFKFMEILLLVLTVAMGWVSTASSGTSLEETISRRRSTHQSGTYTDQNVTQQQLLKVLWAAYGYLPSGCRSVPSVDGSYPLVVYIANATASYRYVPESHSIVLHNGSVTKETIKLYDQGWPSEASAVLVIVWNQTKSSKRYFAAADGGCLAQNVYLEADALGLGTCCVGGIGSTGLRDALGLSSSLAPLFVMPLGYPKKITLSAHPKWDSMTGNLPRVTYGASLLDEAIEKWERVTTWSSENLSLQELSQVLWAAYGYSDVSVQLSGVNSTEVHRTVPSAYDRYSLEIFVSNATGVYEYLSGNKSYPAHSLEEIVYGDKRYEITDACNSQTWAASASSIFVIAFNSSKSPSYSAPFIEIETGCVIQNIFLEAAAWDLGTTVISDGFDVWNGTVAQEIRDILSLTSNIVPLYIMPMGNKVGFFDIAVTCIEGLQGALLQNANVTISNSTTGNKIRTGRTDSHGRVDLTNVPSGTLNIKVYDGNGNQVIGSDNRTITTEGQQETVNCSQNCVTVDSEWRIIQVQTMKSLVLPDSFISVMTVGEFVGSVRRSRHRGRLCNAKGDMSKSNPLGIKVNQFHVSIIV